MHSLRSSVVRARPAATLAVLTTSLSCIALAPLARADDEVVARLHADTGVYSFAEYLPPGYDTEPDDVFHPLVVFLHGAGETAPADASAERVINRASVHGPFEMLKNGDRTFADEGVIVLAPVASGWWNDAALRDFLAYVVAHYRVDWRRVYITGISMGGGGTFTVGNRHRARVAAYVPICPAGNATGAAYVDSAVWGFHSRGDGTVSVDSTWAMLDRVADARAGRDVPAPRMTYPNDSGDHTALFDPATASFSWVTGRVASGSAPLRGTIYPDGSHNSWTRTYHDPAVWTWMFDQERPLPDGLPGETVFVDALHPNVELTGAWERRDDVDGYFFWDFAVAESAAGVRARFPLRPNGAGKYEVYLRHVSVPGAGEATVTIAHAEGEDAMSVDFASDGGRFVSLGRFPFDGDGSLTIAGESGALVADAVAFVYREPLEMPDAGMPASDAGAHPPGDAGTQRSDAGALGPQIEDASLPSGPDAGAGPAGHISGSCACRATAPSSRPTGGLALLVLAAVGGLLRRARRSKAVER